MDIQVGQTASFAKTISESDIYGFAGLVGDFNSAHLHQVEAEKGIFGGRVAHGMLVGSLISTVLGMKLPGSGAIYLEQNLKSKRSVCFGDTATTTVTVEEVVDEPKGIYRMNTEVTNQKGDVVMERYAVVMYRGGA